MRPTVEDEDTADRHGCIRALLGAEEFQSSFSLIYILFYFYEEIEVAIDDLQAKISLK